MGILGLWLGLFSGTTAGGASTAIVYANSDSFADSVVTLNEVMYHPADDSTGEWIEIHNQLAILVDLSHWTLEGGIDFRFPPGTTLAGGGYLVVAADPLRFRATTGREALGPFGGRLSDGGDRVILRNLNRRLMDEMEYGDSEDWSTAADGSGASLAKRHAGSPSGPADNWTFSFEIGGTPGTVNFPNAHLAGGERPGGAPVVFGEVSAADRAAFFCELSNPSAGSAALEGLRIRSSSGGSFRFGAEFLSAGGWRVLGTNELGFAVRSGDRLFLDDGPGGHVLDAVRVTREGRARSTIETGAPFRVPTRATPGEANVFAFHGEIVVNEIFYHAPLRSPAVDEQWIELFNRSDRSVDLSGWRLSDDVEFRFPDGARLASGSYCVVTGDATALERRYPDIVVYGNWTKRLGGRGGRIRLVDADGNPADDVRYFDDDPWPARADGGGSSLELRDPRTDNAVSGAWAASDESGRATWKVYTYRARAVTPVKAPAQNGFHEFRMGLLADGEVWVDDVSVVENPDGARRELMQNGGFDGPRSWRFLGNHGRSSVIDDPEVAGNRILRLVATDARGYMHNQLESTLKAGGVVVPVVTGRTYEISFRAKWIGGSPLLHTELYYNKVARTTVLETPDRHGTPGRPNSMAVTNSGPSFYGLRHEPLSPKPGEAVTVRVRAEDPDGIASMELYTSVNGGAWQRRTMVGGDGGEFVASVPGNTVDSVVQFYVAGRDRRGASAFEPAGGPASRACYRVDTRVAGSRRKAFRFVLTPADGRVLDATTNMMSDDRVGATVVWNDREVFYDCGVHLHGSMFSRGNLDATPYNVKFPADRRYRGVHRSVMLNRGALEEILAKHVQNQAGVPGMYDDLVELYSHRKANAGAARLSMAQYNDIFLGSQFENGTDGQLYNMEGIRVLEATHNGSVEGIKLGMPIGWVGDYDVMNLGDDPEQYRFSTTLRNNRDRNDHGPYIRMAKTFGLTGTALESAVPEVIDVDQWMRYYAVLTLFEIGDTYTFGNPHNINFYARPADGRLVALPYDWDFFFANGDTSPLWGNQNLGKIVSRPVFARLLYGHLHDLLRDTFTREYLGTYVTNFGTVAGQSFTTYLSRIRARGQHVRGRLPAAVPFEITTNGGADLAVSTPEVVLEGRGWVDVREVRVEGLGPLTLRWLDLSRWRATVPLVSTRQTLRLEAFDHRGGKVGEDSIGIVTDRVDDAQRRYLRLCEIHYHPSDVTDAERAAGWVEDDFEFLEIANFGPIGVSLAGMRVDGGVRYAFVPEGAPVLEPGRSVVLARNADAFSVRYGPGVTALGVYEGSLDNAGERLLLIDRQGIPVHEVVYDDEPPWPTAPDGSGPSLEWIAPGGEETGGPADWGTGSVGGSPGVAPKVAVRPRILGIARVPDNRVRVEFVGRPGAIHRIQTRSSLSDGAWSDTETTVTPAPDGRAAWESSGATAEGYFRVATE